MNSARTAPGWIHDAIDKTIDFAEQNRLALHCRIEISCAAERLFFALYERGSFTQQTANQLMIHLSELYSLHRYTNELRAEKRIPSAADFNEMLAKRDQLHKQFSDCGINRADFQWGRVPELTTLPHPLDLDFNFKQLVKNHVNS